MTWCYLTITLHCTENLPRSFCRPPPGFWSRNAACSIATASASTLSAAAEIFARVASSVGNSGMLQERLSANSSRPAYEIQLLLFYVLSALTYKIVITPAKTLTAPSCTCPNWSCCKPSARPSLQPHVVCCLLHGVSPGLDGIFLPLILATCSSAANETDFIARLSAILCVLHPSERPARTCNAYDTATASSPSQTNSSCSMVKNTIVHK